MTTTLKEENYLKALILLSENGDSVGIKQLSDAMDLKMPTVNAMMKKLSLKKLVIYETYKPIQLTEEGKKEAMKVLRKHRLTEMFLVEIMGMGWEEVHDIAEQLEHVESSVFFDKMDAILGHPVLDPHGSPIPDKDGNIVELKGKILSEVKVGSKVKFIAVLKSSSEFLQYLNGKSVKLNDVFELLDREPFDSNLIIKHKNSQMQLSVKASDQMLVELIP